MTESSVSCYSNPWLRGENATWVFCCYMYGLAVTLAFETDG